MLRAVITYGDMVANLYLFRHFIIRCERGVILKGCDPKSFQDLKRTFYEAAKTMLNKPKREKKTRAKFYCVTTGSMKILVFLNMNPYELVRRYLLLKRVSYLDL